MQSSVKALEDISALDATFAVAFLSFDTANRVRITEQPGLLSALVNLLDPDAPDTDSTFADERDLVVRFDVDTVCYFFFCYYITLYRFSLSALSQLALDRQSRLAICNERNALKFIFARARRESKEMYIRMTAMIALSNLLLEGAICESLLKDKESVDALVTIATTVPVVDDVKRKSSATLVLDYSLNALFNLCSSPAWVSSNFKIQPDAQQRLLALASGDPQAQAVFLADRVASCIDPLRSLNHPDGTATSFSFRAIPGSGALGDVAGGVGGFLSGVFAKTKSGLSSVGDATGISKAVEATKSGLSSVGDAAVSGLEKAKTGVVGAVAPQTPVPAPAVAADEASNPLARAFDAVKSGVTAIGDATSAGLSKAVDVAKAGADAAKSGVSAAADATSAGLSKAVDVAKAGADAAKSSVSSAATALPGSSSQPQQESSQAPPPPQLAPELKSGPSVKSLAGKFDVKIDHDGKHQRSNSQERATLSDRPAVPLTFTQHQQQFVYPQPPILSNHANIISVPTTSDVFHC